MTNREIAAILYEVADFLEADDVQFKPRAYRRAAQSVEALNEELVDIYKNGGLKSLDELPDIGAHIAKKIAELLETRKLIYYERLTKKLPVHMSELTAIEGVGPKTVKALYKHLKIRTLANLERAARAGKLRTIPGFHEKSEEKILNGIIFLKQGHGRILLGDALPLARQIVEELKKLSQTKHVVAAGSLRRMQETIGDLDLLAASDDPSKLMDAFCSLPHVEHIYARGSSKSLVRLKQGIDADLRVVPEESFGAALQYFTGNKAHSIATRKLAMKKGLKLNEYGVFKGNKRVAGRTEEEVYRALGLPYIEPELRNDDGEIAAALTGKLPKIIGYNDIRGDLHMHTTWSDGQASMETMVEAAQALGYDYVAITDHTHTLHVAGGMDVQKLRRYIAAIDALQKTMRGITILKGAEVNIMPDGSLDMEDTVLAQLDIVLVGVHSHFTMSKTKMTKRIIAALSHNEVNILVHPTGRVIQQRPAYQIDLDEVAKAAAAHRVALEIDAYPDRLDLNDTHIRHVLRYGVKLAIDTDSHHPQHLNTMELGVAQARRGWARKHDIINTLPLRSLSSFLEKKSASS